MDKATKILLEKYGFRVQAVGGDVLRDVYQDLGARPSYQLTDDRKFIREPKWLPEGKNPKYGETNPNPNYGLPIGVGAALKILVDDGQIDSNWLEGVRDADQ